MPARALVALGERLRAVAPPRLAALVEVLLVGEGFVEFMDLVRQYIPEHEAEILRAAGPDERLPIFARSFKAAYFPLHWVFDGPMDGDVGYDYIVHSIHALPMGWDDEDWHEIDSRHSGHQLLFALCRCCDSSDHLLYDDSLRIPALEACAQHTRRSVLGRIPEGGCTRAELHRLLDGTEYEATAKAAEVALAIARDSEFSSGFLPRDALWWRSGRNGQEVAVWRPPKVWRVALMAEPLQPPRRFSLPMPGLVFICSRSHPPGVWAAKRRPASPEDLVYKAPAFNIFSSGLSCQGTHHYGADLNQLPEEFFRAFFSPTGDTTGRSVKHPNNLLALWEELDGREKYPNDDLVQHGRVKDLLEGKYKSWR